MRTRAQLLGTDAAIWRAIAGFNCPCYWAVWQPSDWIHCSGSYHILFSSPDNGDPLVLPQQAALLKHYVLYFLCRGKRQVLCCSCQCFSFSCAHSRESISPIHSGIHMQTHTMPIFHAKTCYCQRFRGVHFALHACI